MATQQANINVENSFEHRLSSIFLEKGVEGVCPTDLIIQLKNNQEVRMHKYLFMANSHIFNEKCTIARMSGTQTNEDGDLIVQLSIDAAVFNTLLQCIYIVDLSHPQIDFSDHRHAFAVLEAAVYFEMEAVLNKGLVDRVMSLITKETALEALEMARCVSEVSPKYSKVKDTTLKTIFSNGEEVIQSDAFTTLGMHSVEMILSSDLLQVCSELAVFNAIIKWISSKTTVKSTFLSLFDRLRSSIRFERMTSEEIVQIQEHEYVRDQNLYSDVHRYSLHEEHPMYLPPRPRRPRD